VKKCVVSLALLLLAGCGSSVDPLEPPATLTPVVSPALKLQHLWSKRLAGPGQDTGKLVPRVDGERVFVVNDKGLVDAFSSQSGERLWRTDLAVAINAGPGEGDELLLFGGDSEVLAVAKSDGKLVWRAPLSSEVLSVPQRKDDLIVVHSVDGNITALNAVDGKQRWQHHESVPTLSLRGVSDPVIVPGAVIVGTASGKVIALSLSDGGLLWESVVAEPRGHTELERIVDVDMAPVVSDGVVYAASYQDSLVALALRSGQLIWNRGIASTNAMALDRNNLYVTDPNGDVLALSRRNGGVMWKQTALHQRRLTAPVVQGEYLLVGDYQGYLHWLDKTDGHIVARSRIKTWQQYWPVDIEEDNLSDFYHENQAVLAAPAVEGQQVFGFDRRGVLDVMRVAPADGGTE